MARKVSKGSAGGRRRGAARSAARGNGSRASLYDEVTQTIIAQLEDGVFPWVTPWSKAKASLGLPCNAVTKRAYSGINVLILRHHEDRFAQIGPEQAFTLGQAIFLGQNDHQPFGPQPALGDSGFLDLAGMDGDVDDAGLQP